MNTFQKHSSTGKGKIVQVDYSEHKGVIIVSQDDFNYSLDDPKRNTTYFIDAHNKLLLSKHYNKLFNYKTASGALNYAKKHQVKSPYDSQESSPLEQETLIFSGSGEPSSVSCSSSCPRPQSLPTTKVRDEGIQTEVKTSTLCPSVATNAPYGGNSSAGASFLFIDVETTGLSRTDEVIEIAIVDIDENIIYQSLVKPSKPIEQKAIDIHGITNQMVANAPPFHQLWNDLYTLMAGKNLCFYNASRDKRMIYQTVLSTFGSDSFFKSKYKFEHLFTGYNNTPDITCLRTRYERYYSRKSLIGACWEQSIYTNDVPRNRATGDAIKTARLYKHIATPLDHSQYGHPRKRRAGL